MNMMRERLQKGEKLCGTLVCLTDPALCEIVGDAGYDFVWIDLEHTCISCKEALCHLNAARAVGIPALIRVPQHDLTTTKKVMEMGPEAILFPMVKTVEETKELLDMTLYPPHGQRGFGPLRAIRYGADDALEYAEKQSFEMCRFMQIEDVGFIDRMDEICELPFLDGFIFGPNDLSGSLGEFLHVYDEATVAQIKRAIAIARKHGKWIGLAGGMSPETVRFWSGFDLDFLTAGADWNFVYEAGKATLANMRANFGNK